MKKKFILEIQNYADLKMCVAKNLVKTPVRWGIFMVYFHSQMIELLLFHHFTTHISIEHNITTLYFGTPILIKAKENTIDKHSFAFSVLSYKY